MQRIKRVTIVTGEDVRRPGVLGGTNINDTESSWSSEIVTFLTECGVDASYGEIDGSSYEWMTIRGIVSYMAIERSGSNNYLRFYSPGGYISLFYSASLSDLEGEFVLNLCGNPNGTFVLRLFTSAFEYLGGFVIGEFLSTASGKKYMYSRLINSGTSANSVHRIYFPDTTVSSGTSARNIEISNDASNIPAASSDAFLAFDLGDSMLLYPIFYGNVTITGNTNTVNCHYNLATIGVYHKPNGFNLPDAVGKSVLYQREGFVNGRKLLFGGNSFSIGFGLPLLALDEDDPLISEEELMSEVETW